MDVATVTEPPGRSLGGLRVAVVADQALTSEAVRTALTAHGLELVGLPTPDTITRARNLAQQVAEFRPRVGLLLQELDDPLHFRDAMAVLRAVLRVTPEVPWLLLTGTTEQSRWGAGLEAGAAAVLPMSSRLDDLASSLITLAAGGEVMSEEQKRLHLHAWQERSSELRALTERVERLTPREMEILRALCDGRSVSTIAAERKVSVDTVRGQVKSVLRKLEVSSQLAAVAAYQQLVEGAPDDVL